MTMLSVWQSEAVKKFSNLNGNKILWAKIGEGKTRVALFWSLTLFNDSRPLIICSPNANRQWLDEIKLLGLRNRIKPTFLSYGLLSRKELVVIDWRLFNCIIADELWLFKSVKSRRSQRLAHITTKLPSIGLSGSMMTAGNIEDLFGQAKSMNLGHKIAPTLTSFRQQFEIEVTNWAGFPERFPRNGAVESIQRRLIDDTCIYFPKETRELRDIPINLNPTDEQLKAKRQLVNNWLLEHEGKTLEIKSAASLVIKLQQISDGFLKLSERDFMDIDSSKISRIKELCTELLDAGESQLLIWTGFRKTAQKLAEILPVKTTTLTGQGGFDYEGWQKGKIPITIATVGSGASWNDFANVRYSIFYSVTFSSLGYEQAKGRTNRKSTLQNCSYYYQLSTRGFPDARIFQRIKENKSQEDILIETATEVLKQHEQASNK